MANAFTTEQFNVTLVITNAAGGPAPVDGVPVWATSDATVVSVTPAADGMSAVAPCIAPNPVDAAGAPIAQRLTVTADADLGAGVVTITGVSEDIFVTVDPANLASVMTLTLGPAVAKA